MKTERLLQLAGIVTEANENFVIKHKSGDYLRADGYEKTSDIDRAKIFANKGSATRYLNNQLQNFKPAEWEVKPASVSVTEGQIKDEHDAAKRRSDIIYKHMERALKAGPSWSDRDGDMYGYEADLKKLVDDCLVELAKD